jgi:hypothetical protein
MNLKYNQLNFGLKKQAKKLYNLIGINNKINNKFLSKYKLNQLESLKKKLILDSRLKIQLLNIEAFRYKLKLLKTNKNAKKKKN